MILDKPLKNDRNPQHDISASALVVSVARGDGRHLTDLLNSAGFDVENITHRANVLGEVARVRPGVIVLDPSLADERAIALCQQTQEFFDIPVVICSAVHHDSDIVRGLEAGADDYVVMPVRPVEFIARLRAVLRRANTRERDSQSGMGRLTAGEFEIRLGEQRAYRKGVPIDLSPIEFRLLACLIRESGRIVTHSKLLAQAWGPEYADCRHYLRLYIRYLRSKIEDVPRDPRFIIGEWGLGYRFEAIPHD